MQRLGWIPIVALISVLGSPSTGWGQAALRSDVVPRELSVRVEGATALDNVGHIIAELGGRRLLSLRPHVNDVAPDIVAVLRSRGIIEEPELPSRLEFYLCNLNRHVCTIEFQNNRLSMNWALTKASEAVRVEGMSCESLPQFALCLPDLAVHSYLTSRVVPYDSKHQKLDDIVTRGTGGCRTFDRHCQRSIQALNQGKGSTADPLAADYSGRLRVPVRGQSLNLLVFSMTHFGLLTQTLDALTTALPHFGGGKGLEDQARIYYTVPTPARAKGHKPPQDAWLEPVSEYMDALKAMHYPYKSAADLVLRPVMIGVWDTRVDDDHCDLVDARGKAVSIAEPTTGLVADDGSTQPVSQNCGENRNLNRPVFDHGTHVAGIMAARINGHGIAGVNPSAKLWTYELMFGSRLNDDPDPITRVFSQQTSLPVVVNVSLDFPATHGSRTVLANVVSNFRDDVLFVAAAGNDGVNAQGSMECGTIPACWSLVSDQGGSFNGDNVISVVALNKTGTALLPHPQTAGKFSTNYGRAFDVAAVGEAVSALHGNYVGVMRGSSVAAPYVTGLVSLIHATVPINVHPPPRSVKERILFTADFSKAFDSIVRFGRINFSRALAFSRDAITLKSSACGPGVAVCTPTVNLRRSSGDIVALEGKLQNGDELGAPLRIPAKDVRRIMAEADVPNSRYWVAYMSGSRLQLLRGVRFEPTSELVYDMPNDPTLRVNTILDYTACSFVRGCR